MKKYLIVFSLLISVLANAQYKAIVFFKDKDSTEFPVLSQASAERRARLGVTYDESDLPVKSEYIEALKQNGAHVHQISKWLNAVLIESKKPFHPVNLSFISRIEPLNSKRTERSMMSEDISPIAESFSDRNFKMHHGEVLAQNGLRGKGMHIAVFDAGFPGVDVVPGFARLREEGRIKYTRDVVGGTNSVFQYDAHGTHTLSVIAGYLPDNFMGTAIDADISLFVTENAATETPVEEFNWVVAAEVADSLGVDMISSSLGYTLYDDGHTDHVFAELDGKTTIVTLGAVMAARKGILVVNSAGNYRGQQWQKIGAPADADSIITVGAVNVDSVVTNFSSPGPTADGRLKPEVVSLGFRTATIRPDGSLGEANGTSFSCPLIAGLCASLWQEDRSLTNQQIRSIVMSVSHKFATPDTNFGYGIPDFAKAFVKIKSYEMKEAFLLFPNPSGGRLVLRSADISGDVEFTLLNAIGQQVSSISQNVEKFTDVNLSVLINPALASGTYFLRIKHPSGTEEKAIVYQH